MPTEPLDHAATVRVAAAAITRCLDARPSAQRALRAAFRRDISVFRWGDDRVEALLDHLGVEYREYPSVDSLAGAVAVAGATRPDRGPTVAAARRFLARGGVLLTTGQSLELWRGVAKEAEPSLDRGAEADESREQWRGGSVATRAEWVGSPGHLAWALGGADPTWWMEQDAALVRGDAASDVVWLRGALADDSPAPGDLVIARRVGGGTALHCVGPLSPRTRAISAGPRSAAAVLVECTALDEREAGRLPGADARVDEGALRASVTACAVLVESLLLGLMH